MTGSHENWSRADSVKSSSDRTLGLVFSVFFAGVALLPLWRGNSPRGWAGVLSGLFLLLALLVPKALGPLNRAWTLLGVALHRITSPIFLGIIFYGVFTPFGWVLRLLGKDYLRLKPAQDACSYWIMRQPPGPEPKSMANQF